MKLFTKDIDQKLFEQYPKGSDLNNQMVVAKIFNPYGRGTWYLLNSDPEDPDYIWAITDLFEIEVGSVSRTDLESIKFKPFMLGLERDMYFTPVNAMELYKGLQSGKQYAKGGGVGKDRYNLSFNYNPSIIKNEYAEGIVSKYTKDWKHDNDWDEVTFYVEGLTKEQSYELKAELKMEDVYNVEIEKSAYKYAKGGGVKYYNKENEYRLSRPSSNIEKEILDRVTFKESMTNDMFVGSFGWKTPQGKIAEGYLYKLDDFDKNLIKNVSLKSGEKVFRYVNRATAIGGMMPFIKINLEKSLLYFLIHNENDDIIFETRGVNAMFINIIEDKMAHGGGVDVKIPTQGTMISKDKKNKIDYKKVGNNYELIVYEGEPNAVENYSRTSFKKKSNGVVTMNHNQFINYIYTEGYVDDKMAEGGGIKPFKIEKNNTTIYINGTENDIRKMYLDYLNNFLTLGAFAEHYGISDEQALMIIEKGKKYAKDSGKYADGGNTETSILLSTKSVQELVDKFNNAVFKGVGGINEGKKYYEIQASKFAADGIKRELPSGYVLKNVGGDLYWIIQPSFVGKKASEIKRMADGGGVESKIRGGIKYVQGQDLEWHDIMSFDIATYGEKEAEKKAYDYIQDSIKYWNGELNEDDFNVKRSRNGKDYKGSWVVMRQFPKFANGGNIESENAEMVKSYNKQIAHHTKEMNEAMNKNGEVPAWVVAKMTRSASDLSDATHFMEGKGEEYAKGGAIGDNVHIMDEKSLMNNKSGVIIGDEGTFWLVKTLNGTGLVKKSKVKVIEEYATGGSIGFIPMDLEEKLAITAKWGGTDINGVIGILNAMIDSGLTDEDLKPKQTKSGSAFEKAIDSKTKEIWAKIKPQYKGDFEGNMYYSTIKRLVERSGTDDNILKRFKPFRKNQNFATGGGVVELYDTYAFKTKKIAEKNEQEIKSYFGDRLLKSEIVFGTDNKGQSGFQVKYELKKEYAKGGGVSSIPKSIMDKINEINDLIEWAKDKDNIVGGYFGGTHYEYLDFEKPITTNNQFVYIEYNKGGGSRASDKYNVNKKGQFDSEGLVELKAELSRILSAFKRAKKKYDEKGYFKSGGTTNAQKRKVGKVMHEFKEGTLHSGKSDKIVKNPKQAIAIALSEAGLSKKEHGGGMGWNARMKNWKKK